MAIKYPLRLRGSQDTWWDIYDADGHTVCHMTAICIDGSCRPKYKERGGLIFTREECEARAREVFRLLSAGEGKPA